MFVNFGYGLNILFRRKGLGVAYNGAMPSDTLGIAPQS